MLTEVFVSFSFIVWSYLLNLNSTFPFINTQICSPACALTKESYWFIPVICSGIGSEIAVIWVLSKIESQGGELFDRLSYLYPILWFLDRRLCRCEKHFRLGFQSNEPFASCENGPGRRHHPSTRQPRGTVCTAFWTEQTLVRNGQIWRNRGSTL